MTDQETTDGRLTIAGIGARSGRREITETGLTDSAGIQTVNDQEEQIIYNISSFLLQLVISLNGSQTVERPKGA
jgi:hypothetical protein